MSNIGYIERSFWILYDSIYGKTYIFHLYGKAYMTKRVNFVFRLIALILMVGCVVFNQRVDAVLIGLLALLATTRYD